jgi:hypothetical protein
MEYDRSWEALVRPGEGGAFFHSPCRERKGLPPFRRDATAYRPANAWWLSEMCRLIYRRGREELGEAAPDRSRGDILAAVGMRELHFFHKPSAQCGLFSTLPDAKDGFAALVFRGTNGLETWLSNLTTLQVRWPAGGLVHSGFKKEFYRIWPEVAEALDSLSLPVFYAGHSLGGALSVMAASLRPPRAVYTFGAPRVGDAGFAATLSGVPIFRVASDRDIVTGVPPSRIPFDFCHVGESIRLRAGEPETVAPPEARGEGVPDAPAPENGDLAARRQFFGPPEFLSEHAPVNYTFHLFRELRAPEPAATDRETDPPMAARRRSRRPPAGPPRPRAPI